MSESVTAFKHPNGPTSSIYNSGQQTSNAPEDCANRSQIGPHQVTRNVMKLKIDRRGLDNLHPRMSAQIDIGRFALPLVPVQNLIEQLQADQNRKEGRRTGPTDNEMAFAPASAHAVA